MNHEPTTDNATRSERSQRNRALFNKKRDSFLQDLIRSLDLLVYAQLSAVYYMDCSFIRFLVRAVVQFMFLTPKPAFLPEPPANKPYIGAILGVNLMCTTLHLLFPPPEASEATRGYLHGGLAMDFIGQEGPTSKLHLFLLDVLILVLQLVNLAAFVTRQRVKQQMAAPTAPSAVQTHDFEERGQHRSDHEPIDPELDSLNRSDARPDQSDPEADDANDDTTTETQQLLASTAQRSDSHIFDAFNSGEILIADLNLFEIVKTQLKEYQNPVPTEPSTGTSPSPEGLRARVAGRNLFLRMRMGDRVFSV